MEISESESRSVRSDSLRPHGPYSPWNFLGQNSGVGSLSLLQRNLPKVGIKPSPPTLQADSSLAEPPGKPKNTGVYSCPFSSRSSWPRDRTGVSCTAGGSFANWAARGANETRRRAPHSCSSNFSYNCLSMTKYTIHIRGWIPVKGGSKSPKQRLNLSF